MYILISDPNYDATLRRNTKMASGGNLGYLNNPLPARYRGEDKTNEPLYLVSHANLQNFKIANYDYRPGRDIIRALRDEPTQLDFTRFPFIALIGCNAAKLPEDGSPCLAAQVAEAAGIPVLAGTETVNFHGDYLQGHGGTGAIAESFDAEVQNGGRWMVFHPGGASVPFTGMLPDMEGTMRDEQGAPAGGAYRNVSSIDRIRLVCG